MNSEINIKDSLRNIFKFFKLTHPTKIYKATKWFSVGKVTEVWPAYSANVDPYIERGGNAIGCFHNFTWTYDVGTHSLTSL